MVELLLIGVVAVGVNISSSSSVINTGGGVPVGLTQTNSSVIVPNDWM